MMTIEQICSHNIDKLTELTLELWNDCEFQEEIENYRDMIYSEKETCFLIMEKGNYIGFINLSIRNDYVEGGNSRPVGYIEGIYVKPEFRHTGAGRILVDSGINWVKEKGCNQIASNTESSNEASINFHQKIGFVEINQTVNFIKDV